MAQGKLKVKAKLPNNVKQKKKHGPSQGAVTKRNNRPVAPKKKAFQESAKLKKLVTKSVNKAVEDEIRSRATDVKSLSKAQQAVVAHHEKMPAPSAR